MPPITVPSSGLTEGSYPVIAKGNAVPLTVPFCELMLEASKETVAVGNEPTERSTV